MHIVKSKDNLPVKNIIFECPSGFEIKTRYIHSNLCEVGLFNINDPTKGWNNTIDITYYEEGNTKNKYIILFNNSSISSQIKTVHTEFTLIKSSFDNLPKKYHENKSGRIPQTIIQTHKSYTFGKREYYDASRSWILKNPGYTYIFYDNNDCELFIKQFFPVHVLTAWKTLIPGAFKSDIFRYCVLHHLGGFYVDFDTICVTSLDNLYNKKTIFTSAREPNLYNHLWNAFIGIEKSNPITNIAINMSCLNVLKKIKNIDTLSLTGPGILGKALNISLNRNAYYNIEHGYLLFNNSSNIILYQNNNPPNWTMTANRKILLVSKWNGYNSSNYWNRNWYY